MRDTLQHPITTLLCSTIRHVIANPCSVATSGADLQKQLGEPSSRTCTHQQQKSFNKVLLTSFINYTQVWSLYTVFNLQRRQLRPGECGKAEKKNPTYTEGEDDKKTKSPNTHSHKQNSAANSWTQKPHASKHTCMQPSLA